jgi:hypothetical protein
MGMTDTFKGTGVFNSVEFQRDDAENKNDAKAQATAEKPKEKETTPK